MGRRSVSSGMRRGGGEVGRRSDLGVGRGEVGRRSVSSGVRWGWGWG